MSGYMMDWYGNVKSLIATAAHRIRDSCINTFLSIVMLSCMNVGCAVNDSDIIHSTRDVFAMISARKQLTTQKSETHC